MEGVHNIAADSGQYPDLAIAIAGGYNQTSSTRTEGVCTASSTVAICLSADAIRSPLVTRQQQDKQC